MRRIQIWKVEKMNCEQLNYKVLYIKNRTENDMKKLFISIFVFFVIGSIFADEFTISREIPEKFTGTYIPVLFDTILRKTHSYEEAMSKSHMSGNYDILMLSNEICYSYLWFHDGYAIDAKKIDKWKFFKKDNNKNCNINFLFFHF